MRKKTIQNSEPFQIRWGRDLKMEFEKVVKEYDQFLPLSTAILKLVTHAVEEKWLPGYERKPRGHNKPIEGGDYSPSPFDAHRPKSLESIRKEISYGKKD